MLSIQCRICARKVTRFQCNKLSLISVYCHCMWASDSHLISGYIQTSYFVGVCSSLRCSEVVRNNSLVRDGKFSPSLYFEGVWLTGSSVPLWEVVEITVYISELDGKSSPSSQSSLLCCGCMPQ